MSNPWVVAATFVAVFACTVIACLCLRVKDRGHALAFFLAALLWAYQLTQIPAPVATPQEAEPTPWSTETPASGWQDFYDALVVTDTQLDYRLAAVETYIWSAPTATSYPTVIPTATPTATPSLLCKPCSYDGECGAGLRCYLCADKRGRCVLSGFTNSSCRSCIEQGR